MLMHGTHKEFTKALATSFGKPIWLPNIPSFILKIVFGELSQVLLYGSRISPNKIIEAGFRFQYDDINKTLNNLFHTYK